MRRTYRPVIPSARRPGFQWLRLLRAVRMATGQRFLGRMARGSGRIGIRPCHTRAHRCAYSLTGSDVPSWHNVYTQRAPDAPSGFTVQDTTAGQVLADARGMTIYLFQLWRRRGGSVELRPPDTTQSYRIAFCGGAEMPLVACGHFLTFSAAECAHQESDWRAIDIDPQTGRFAEPGRGAVHVWAYRDRPVYTYSGDRHPAMSMRTHMAISW